MVLNLYTYTFDYLYQLNHVQVEKMLTMKVTYVETEA